MAVSDIQDACRLGSPAAAAAAARFFKTGPGQYGEGDIFLGLRAKEMHQMSKEHGSLPFGDLANAAQISGARRPDARAL